MNRKYLALISRIEEELADIEILVNKVINGWKYVKKTGDSFYLDSVALNLHGFYSALERIFLLIAQEIDESIPEGGSWHQDLLMQMKTEIKKVRPAVISRETYQRLDEYRGFRHVVRNVYTFNLSMERIEPLVDNIENIFFQIKDELGRFTNFIEKVSEN
ncbi:MAG: hypothetical protein PWR10_1101 [Halanaerobiales bacterium]|nr:hypothetical protein [Halanaerobiales bacterium]